MKKPGDDQKSPPGTIIAWIWWRGNNRREALGFGQVNPAS
jgi:hypothetical protein